jgi:hypothetical protein
VVLVNLEESWFSDEHGSGEFELKVRDWLFERYSPEAVVEKGRQEPALVELSRLSQQDRQGALERARLLILRRAGGHAGRSN